MRDMIKKIVLWALALAFAVEAGLTFQVIGWFRPVFDSLPSASGSAATSQAVALGVLMAVLALGRGAGGGAPC